MIITAKDKNDLKQAKLLLENPNFFIKLVDIIGVPIEAALDRFPEKVNGIIAKTTEEALHLAINAALKTMDSRKKITPSRKLHKMLGAVSGGIGGFFGFAALSVELPATTVLMFRAIADIARSHGEDLNSIEARLACIEVFSISGRTELDDSSESGYYAVRLGLDKLLKKLAEEAAKKAAIKNIAPIIEKVISKISVRYSLIVTEKIGAQAIPLLGAVGGATINTLFIDHFQDIAEGHFTARRLERKYGQDFIKKEYEKIKI